MQWCGNEHITIRFKDVIIVSQLNKPYVKFNNIKMDCASGMKKDSRRCLEIPEAWWFVRKKLTYTKIGCKLKCTRSLYEVSCVNKKRALEMTACNSNEFVESSGDEVLRLLYGNGH